MQDHLNFLPGGKSATVISPAMRYPRLQRYQKLREQMARAGSFSREFCQVHRIALPYVPKVGEYFLPQLFFSKALRKISREHTDFDLIHAFWAYRSGYVAMRLAKKFNKPFIISVLGSDLNQWLYERKKRAKTLAGLEQASAIVAVSSHLKEILISEGISETKIHVIPNSVHLEKFSPRPSSLLKQRQDKFGRNFVFICVANLYLVKGVDLLIRALAKCKKTASVIILGDGPERNNLEKTVEEHGLQNRVWFVGRRSHNEIPAWINASDALVLPSRSEGAPAVILEALACGKPVVATDTGFTKDVIDETLGRVVPVEDVPALSLAMDEIAGSSWETEEISQKAEAFSFQRFEERIKNVYNGVLNTSQI